MKRIIVLALAFTLAFAFMAPVSMNFESGSAGDEAYTAYAADSTTWDSKNWVRIQSEYGDWLQIGKYYYYYRTAEDQSTFRIYRENVNTGSKKLLQKVTSYQSPEFYTNGEKLIFCYDKYDGTVMKVKDLSTSKIKTLVDLTKFETSKSTDSSLYINVYGNYLYYSKYRGLSTMIYKVYKVNVKTAKQYTVSSKYLMIQPEDPASPMGRYFIVADKAKNYKIYDTKEKDYKKFTGKYLKSYNRIGNYFYYVTSSKSGSTRSYKVLRKKESGGTYKTIASFKKNYSPDDIIRLTDKGLFFLRTTTENGYTMEYRYAKKKFIRHNDMDVWYYINDNMRFM